MCSGMFSRIVRRKGDRPSIPSASGSDPSSGSTSTCNGTRRPSVTTSGSSTSRPPRSLVSNGKILSKTSSSAEGYPPTSATGRRSIRVARNRINSGKVASSPNTGDTCTPTVDEERNKFRDSSNCSPVNSRSRGLVEPFRTCARYSCFPVGRVAYIGPATARVSGRRIAPVAQPSPLSEVEASMTDPSGNVKTGPGSTNARFEASIPRAHHCRVFPGASSEGLAIIHGIPGCSSGRSARRRMPGFGPESTCSSLQPASDSPGTGNTPSQSVCPRNRASPAADRTETAASGTGWPVSPSATQTRRSPPGRAMAVISRGVTRIIPR